MPNGHYSEELEDNQTEILELRQDILKLVLRLMGEDENTFSPECAEVMARWRPEAEAMLAGNERKEAS